MNIDHFFKEFQFVVSSSDGLESIRNLILELAFRGKLSTSDQDGIATSKYIEEILSDRKRLVEAGKIKREPPLSPIDTNETPWRLPNHWSWCRLGEVTNYGNIERRELKDVEISTWVLELQDIEKNSFKVKNKIKVNERKFKSTKNAFEKGDVLYGKLRPYLNKVLVADEPGVCSTEIVPFHPYINIDPYYLAWVLRSPYFVDYASSSTHGMSLPRLSTYLARMALIPISPPSEQKQIVVKIEELMALCDQLESKQTRQGELRQKANQSLVSDLTNSETTKNLESSWIKYSTYIPSLLNTEDSIELLKEAIVTLGVIGKLEDFITDDGSQKIIKESLAQKRKLLVAKEINRRNLIPPLTPDEIRYDYPSHWSVSRFEKLGYVSGGITKGRRFKDRTTASYPFLRVANVQSGHFLLDDVQEIEVPEDEFEKYVLRNGDILIAEGGDWDKVGRTAIWRDQIQNCLHQNHVFKARLFSERVEKEWIELVFNSSVGRQYWTGASKQTTNLASINMTQVRTFPVPIPSQSEQQRILLKVNDLLSICDELIENIRKFQKVQENFSKAAIYSILSNETMTNVTDTDQFQTTTYDRQIIIKINLVSTMNNDLSNTILAKILKEHGGQMDAKELWKASELKKIDDFYDLLKKEIEDGFIQEPDIAELKLVETVE